MHMRTIIVYHSLEATGSGRDPSVRSQNLNDRNFSSTQHAHNVRDHEAAARAATRQYGAADTPLSHAERARLSFPPQAPLQKAGGAAAYDQQGGRVVRHLGNLSGGADKSSRTVDDSDLKERQAMYRSAPRTKYGRDADLTVLGEVVLDDPSYTSHGGGERAAPDYYQAQSRQSPNGVTSNAFSVVDGSEQGSPVSFSSKAEIVASGQSYVVVAINELTVAFVHTPNSIANTRGAGGFYSNIGRSCQTGLPDIVVGDTNQRGMIAGLLGNRYRSVPPSEMTTVARPEGFTPSGTNSKRNYPFDQIAYNTETTEMLSAHFIPSDISGATISDHFGLIFCARKKATDGNTVAKRGFDGGADDNDQPLAKRRRV
ncbi:hypothetical protein [Brytella acorum]|uniref:Uncharacterized protein n=1 Tax=Brytella acorum TaxID=2959299 RepID=A0AA35XYN1_9PROT|nr:hypothetical protein [Brytella acorum]CAI9121512.1 hypothetical protein LMG32879_002359 [Brytella acorum]